MCKVVAYKRLKTMKNYNALTSKGGCSRLREVPSIGLDWEKFGVLDRWSFMGGGHL